jgi:DNA-binding NarL/FixJ family response regulator
MKIADVAQRLNLCVQTVKNHLNNIYNKSKCSPREVLAHCAYERAQTGNQLFSVDSPAIKKRVDQLHHRELLVLASLSDGRSYSEIAKIHDVTPATIERTCGVIREKIGVAPEELQVFAAENADVWRSKIATAPPSQAFQKRSRPATIPSSC